jgi:hypothetical protein
MEWVENISLSGDTKWKSKSVRISLYIFIERGSRHFQSLYNWGDYILFGLVFIYKNNHIEIL